MKKLTVLLVVLFTIWSPFRVYGSENNEIDLSTSPNKVLFDLTNIKPGDTMTRNLTIQNNGAKDFNYTASSKFLSGSQELFDKLDLTVKDNSKLLYEGKLFEFDKLSSRLLKSKQTENLQFVIKFPMDMGNEFQGLGTDFQIKLYVEGTLGGVLPVNGPKLPTTGTDMFNILVAGAVLVITGSIIQYSLSRRRRIDRRRV